MTRRFAIYIETPNPAFDPDQRGRIGAEPMYLRHGGKFVTARSVPHALDIACEILGEGARHYPPLSRTGYVRGVGTIVAVEVDPL